MSESFDDVIHEYISFVNDQVGIYMDALAGFAGHHVRVERQVHRVSRPVGRKKGENGEPIIVYASYEDPSKLDVIHNRIIRAEDYQRANESGGSSEQNIAKAITIFLFTYWEDEIRPRLAAAKNVSVNEISSDIMGDLRSLRHVILHKKSIMVPEYYKKLKLLNSIFSLNQPIHISYENMHKMIFVLIKQDCVRLMNEWLGVKDPLTVPEEIVDVAIQRGKIRKNET